MNADDINLWRWAGILILAGGIFFWIGAFTLPYKQWMTKDVKEYLTIIGTHKTNWHIIHAFFLVGVIVNFFGITLLTDALKQQNQNMLPQLAYSAFIIGTILWIIDIAFRVVYTTWAAKQFVEFNEIQNFYVTLRTWSSSLFSVYMVLAYLATGFIGTALLQSQVLPNWIGWFCIVFGYAGSVLYIVRFQLFDPPLMVHLPYMILGIAILVKLKAG